MPLTRKSRPIEISYKTFIKFFLILLGFWLLYYLGGIILAVLLAVVIASALEPVMEWCKHNRVPRVLGAITVYLATFFVFVGIVYMVFPPLFDEVQGFFKTYPLQEKKLLHELDRLNTPFLSSLITDNVDVILNGSGGIGKLGGGVFQFTSNIFGGVFSTLIVIVLSFYLVTQERGIENFLRIVTPLEYETYAIDLWTRSQKKMGQWLRAQFLLAALIGLMAFLGLTILGVKYALLLALFAAVFEIIPIVGPILAAAPAVFVAFLQKPLLGLMVVAMYVLIQQMESHLIVPVVMRRAVGLNPLIVIISLLIGAQLGGIIGLFLAVPVAAVVVEFVVDIDKKKRAVVQQVHAS
ncbi:MAG: AI-2E family transporter [bacterium]|nr:AI-2E family transporter [bacterium]